MEAGDDGGYFDQLWATLRSAAWLGQVPWMYWVHDFCIPTLGDYLAVNARHGYFRTFAIDQIEARRTRGGGHQDILIKLLTMNKSKPLDFPDNGVSSMATSNIFAGSDTTAISIRAVLYYLCKNSECMGKLVREIDKLSKAGQISIPPTVQQAQEMPYLRACLHEALRLHPAVGMSLKRVTPPNGIKVNGFYFLQGVSCPKLCHVPVETIVQNVLLIILYRLLSERTPGPCIGIPRYLVLMLRASALNVGWTKKYQI